MIDSSSGEITLVGSLDAEAVSEHHIMVTATDGKMTLIGQKHISIYTASPSLLSTMRRAA